MINKSLRTKEKYAKAAAELDILDECLSNIKNTTDLLPAKEIDYICNLHYKINYFRILLENKAISDFAGNTKFDELPISEIFFKPDKVKNKIEGYAKRYSELKNLL